MSFPRHPDHHSRITRSAIAAIFTLSISGIFLGVIVIFYMALIFRENLQVERTQMSMLSSAKQSKAVSKFLDCIIEANKILDGSSYAEAQSVKKDCQKGRAQEQLNFVRQLQSEGRQEDALKLVAPLAKFDAEAKRMMEEIASGLLKTAKLHYQERSLDYYNHATYPILAIPLDSSYYNTAQTLHRQWHAEYTNNRNQIQVAQAALEQENAFQVQQALEQVSVHPFWQELAKAINQELGFLINYQTAEAFMERREFENAIAEAKKLPNVPPWAERGSNLINRAEATLQRQELCKTVTLGLLQKCYS